MNLRIYRIDRSCFGKVVHFFKKPDLPLALNCLGFRGVFEKIDRTLNDLLTDNFNVLTDKSEVAKFKDPRGYDLIDNTYYIRHPKQQRTNHLIPAEVFHRHIIREQISDIISYVRSNVNLSKLDISITDKKSANINVESLLKEIPIEGKAKLHFEDDYVASIECKSPLKPSQKRLDIVWINDFPNTKAIIDEASNGQFYVKEKFNLSFGLSLKVAKQICVDANYTGAFEYNFNMTVK